MKFLVDAQLLVRLADLLQKAGYDTIPTINSPLSNATPDSDVNAISIRESRIVITSYILMAF